MPKPINAYAASCAAGTPRMRTRGFNAQPPRPIDWMSPSHSTSPFDLHHTHHTTRPSRRSLISRGLLCRKSIPALQQSHKRFHTVPQPALAHYSHRTVSFTQRTPWDGAWQTVGERKRTDAPRLPPSPPCPLSSHTRSALYKSPHGFCNDRTSVGWGCVLSEQVKQGRDGPKQVQGLGMDG